MKIPFILMAACLLPAIAPAAPLSVTWGAQGSGAALATATGQELPSGCLVRLGFFDQSVSQLQESAWDLGFLERHFTEIARTHTGEFDGTQFAVAGSFAQTFALDSAQLPSGTSNRSLWVWACNASEAPAATEIGLFTHADWKLNSSLVGGLIWDLNQVEADGLVVGSTSPTQSPTLGGQMNQLSDLGVLWDAADSDRDGVQNLLEEALGMNLAAPDSQLMPEVIVLENAGQTQPGYRYRRPIDGQAVNATTYEGGDFRYIVEVSDDLQNWRTDPYACQVHDTVPTGDGFEVVTLYAAAPHAPTVPAFYRLKVEWRG